MVVMGHQKGRSEKSGNFEMEIEWQPCLCIHLI